MRMKRCLQHLRGNLPEHRWEPVSGSKPKYNKKEYNKAYFEANKEKYNKMSKERNMERYYTNAEYREKIIERAKISVKNRTLNAMKSILDPDPLQQTVYLNLNISSIFQYQIHNNHYHS